MTPEYISESLGTGLLGVPIGMLLGYALAKTENFYRSHHHSHRRNRDHS